MLKYCPTHKSPQMLGGKLDPKWLPYLRNRSRLEIKSDTSFNARRFTKIPDEWVVLEKIFGNPEGETGTKVRRFRKDNCKGMVSNEAGGLDIEYLSVNGEKICFAQIDPEKRDDSKLFSGVAAFFSKAPRGKPVSMIRFDNEKGKFAKEWISRNDYQDIFLGLLDAPAPRVVPADSLKPRQPEIETKEAAPGLLTRAWRQVVKIKNAAVGASRTTPAVPMVVAP
jgi:hypothetical protein